MRRHIPQSFMFMDLSTSDQSDLCFGGSFFYCSLLLLIEHVEHGVNSTAREKQVGEGGKQGSTPQ